MTQAIPQHPGPPTPGAPTAQGGAQRSMLRRVLGSLLLAWSVRISLVWIVLLALAAVFAPFLASSHPLLMRTVESTEPLTILSRYEPGSLSSPLLQYLTAADVLLPLLLVALLVTALWRGASGPWRALAFVTFAGLVVVLGLWREHLGPFVAGGHEIWWQDLADWRGDIERQPGVPPRLPVGLMVWWAMLWVGLSLLVAGTVLAASAMVSRMLHPEDQVSHVGLFWLVLGGVAVGVAAWVGVLQFADVRDAGGWLAPALWAVGLVAGVAALLIVAWRAPGEGGYRLLGLLALVSALLIGGWMVHSPVTPARLPILEQYRQAQDAGEIAWAIRTPIRYSPDDTLYDQRGMRFQPPGADHLLGTTALSADLASNMIHGTRIALSVGFISTSIAIVIGILIGGLMGYFSGVFDLLGMRLVEMFSAIPTLFLMLAFVAAFGANLYILMIIIGLTTWTGFAIFIRAEFLKLRQQEFIQAAQAMGLPLRSILFRHMLPNGVAPMLVAASFGVAGAIGYEATLSFLGVGLDTEASWGLLLSQALAGGSFMWWIAITPGLAIFLTVFAYILIGEALRDAIDPRTQRRA